MKKLFVLFYMLAFTSCLFAQLTICPFDYMLKEREKIVNLVPAEIPNIEYEGKDIKWHFHLLDDEYEKMRTEVSDDTLLSVYCLRGIRRFGVSDKGVFFSSYENPLMKIDFLRLMFWMPKVISYGDSLSSTLSFSGKYCGKYTMRGEGVRSVTCHAYGSIVEDGKNYEKQFMLVRCVNLANFSVYVPTLANSMKMDMREETCIWYASDTGKPLYIYDTLVLNDVLGGKVQASKTVKFADEDSGTEQEELGMGDSFKDETNDDLETEEEIFNYDVVNAGNHIYVTYDIKEEADVTIVLCNVAGIPYFRESRKHLAGRGYSVSIDTAGLPRGNYVVYMNVNGKVYSVKIKKNRL